MLTTTSSCVQVETKIAIADLVNTKERYQKLDKSRGVTDSHRFSCIEAMRIKVAG
jgi:hypothetical protein